MAEQSVTPSQGHVILEKVVLLPIRNSFKNLSKLMGEDNLIMRFLKPKMTWTGCYKMKKYVMATMRSRVQSPMLREGDRNTKFFHFKTSQIKHRIEIKSIGSNFLTDIRLVFGLGFMWCLERRITLFGGFEPCGELC